MKGRYWIFGYDCYYASGGLNDFLFSFDTLTEYDEKESKHNCDAAYQLLDTRTNYHFEVGSKFNLRKWIDKNVKQT